MIAPARLLFAPLVLGICSTVVKAEVLKRIAPEPAQGRSVAVSVSKTSLAHTGQIFAVDAGAALTELAKVLESAGSSLGQVVKLNVYLAQAEDEGAVRKVIAERFGKDALPAVSVVASPLPESSARVGVDAVAIGDGKREAGAKVRVLSAERASVYVSGQAERGKTLEEATAGTMVGLSKTLEFLGLSWADVIQLKAFVNPMRDVATAEAAMKRSFADGEVPPIVFVEWQSIGAPIEIELIASAPAASASGPVEFLTPPGVKASPVFARVTRIPPGPRIYISSLTAPEANDPTAQVKAVFEQLTTALKSAGSDLQHLVKATYYVSADDVSKKLNELRPEYYHPERPPAASKAPVAKVGPGTPTLNIDMIAVPSTGAAQ